MSNYDPDIDHLPPPINPDPTGPAEPNPLREVALLAAAQRLSGLSEVREGETTPRVIRHAEIYLAWLEERDPA